MYSHETNLNETFIFSLSKSLVDKVKVEKSFLSAVLSVAVMSPRKMNCLIPTLMFLSSLSPPVRSRCSRCGVEGSSRQSRIMHGTETRVRIHLRIRQKVTSKVQVNQYPWMVSVYWEQPPHCGGSLMSSKGGISHSPLYSHDNDLSPSLSSQPPYCGGSLVSSKGGISHSPLHSHSLP